MTYAVLSGTLTLVYYTTTIRCTLEVPGPLHTARLGRVFCVCIFSLGLRFACLFVFFDLFVSPILCFLGQLSHLPYSFWR